MRNIAPNLVHAGCGHAVRTAIVAGSVIVRDGEVLFVDRGAIRAKAQVWAEAAA